MPHKEWTYQQKLQWALRNGVDPNLPEYFSGKTRQRNYDDNMMQIKLTMPSEYAIMKAYQQTYGHDCKGYKWAEGVDYFKDDPFNGKFRNKNNANNDQCVVSYSKKYGGSGSGSTRTNNHTGASSSRGNNNSSSTYKSKRSNMS